MRILCLIDSLGSGGAQRQLVGLADLLKAKGNVVKVVYYHDVHFFKPFLEERGVESEYLAGITTKFSKFWKVFQLVKVYKPDVLIAYLDGATMLGCLLRIAGLKFRLIVSERSITEFLNWKRRIKFFLYRWSDAIVPNSYAESELIGKFFPVLKNKIHTVTNFVDTDYFSPVQAGKATSPTIRILCVARIGSEKNVMLFMQAVKLVVERGYSVRVDWFGTPSQKTPEYFKACLTERGRLDMTDIFNFKPASGQIRDEYRKADVFCLPSLYEGFPNVICEAMSCGLPVLCSRVGDNPRLVEEGKNGYLFPPDEVEKIADSIIRFCECSQEKKIEMGQYSRRIAVQRFSGEKFVSQYMEIFA